MGDTLYRRAIKPPSQLRPPDIMRKEIRADLTCHRAGVRRPVMVQFDAVGDAGWAFGGPEDRRATQFKAVMDGEQERRIMTRRVLPSPKRMGDVFIHVGGRYGTTFRSDHCP